MSLAIRTLPSIHSRQPRATAVACNVLGLFWTFLAKNSGMTPSYWSLYPIISTFLTMLYIFNFLMFFSFHPSLVISCSCLMVPFLLSWHTTDIFFFLGGDEAEMKSRFYMWEKICLLSFWVWLTSLNIMISLFYCWICMCHIFAIH